MPKYVIERDLPGAGSSPPTSCRRSRRSRTRCSTRWPAARSGSRATSPTTSCSASTSPSTRRRSWSTPPAAASHATQYAACARRSTPRRPRPTRRSLPSRSGPRWSCCGRDHRRSDDHRGSKGNDAWGRSRRRPRAGADDRRAGCGDRGGPAAAGRPSRGADRAAGASRLLLSSSYGGIGADLAGAMAVFEAMATADASTGWTVMIGAGSWVDRTGLPRTTFDQLYADGPDAIGPDQLGQRPDGADGIGVSARRRVHLTPRPSIVSAPRRGERRQPEPCERPSTGTGTGRPPTAHRADEPIRARRAMLRPV